MLVLSWPHGERSWVWMLRMEKYFFFSRCWVKVLLCFPGKSKKTLLRCPLLGRSAKFLITCKPAGSQYDQGLMTGQEDTG